MNNTWHVGRCQGASLAGEFLIFGFKFLIIESGVGLESEWIGESGGDDI
jgi:hypothetical protein